MTHCLGTLHSHVFRLSIILLLQGALLLSGCGPERLSRTKAEQLIVAAIKAAQPVTNTFMTGAYGSSIEGSKPQWVVPLVGRGVVTLRSLGTRDQIFQIPMSGQRKDTYFVYSIDLTPEGQKYKVLESRTGASYPYESPFYRTLTYSHMKMAEPAFVAVTGIVEQPSGKNADVEFTWKYVNITPFGEVAPLLNANLDYSSTKVRSDKVTVTKYDDGWRLPNRWPAAGADH